MSCLPNFIIVGAPRSGTTSIYHYLRSHPQVFMANTTELGFFNADELLGNLNGPGDGDASSQKICRTMEQYQKCFSTVAHERVIGECTTTYLHSDAALSSIKKTLGDNVKILVMLRTPVARTFSNYMYFVRNGREVKSFPEALKEEETRRRKGWNNAWYSKHLSMYSERISTLKSLGLPFQVTYFENFVANPQREMERIYRFLDVDATFVPDNIDVIYNKGGVYQNKWLVNWMKGPSQIRRALKGLLPQHFIAGLRRKRAQFIYNQTKTVTIDPEVEEELKMFFESDVLALEKELPKFDKTIWGY